MKSFYESNDTFGDMQSLLRIMYGVANDRNYSTEGIALRISRYSTRMLKGLRKKNDLYIKNNMVYTFSWAIALANRIHIDVAAEIWRRFPDCCPYCAAKPCSCSVRPPERVTLPTASMSHPGNVSNIQDMLRNIYPKNTLEGSVIHTAEESGEVSEATQAWMSTHKTKDYEDLVLELVDLFANLLAVASCLDVRMDEAFGTLYSQGCPECRKSVCECCFKDTVHSK